MQGAGEGIQPRPADEQAAGGVVQFPLDAITVRDNIRQNMGDARSLDDLAASMREIGLLHPIIVQRDGVLVVGQRRLIAAKRLGWTTIPARIWEELTEEERFRIQAEENLRRKELEQEERRRAEALRRQREEAGKDQTDVRIHVDTNIPSGGKATRGRVGSVREHSRFLGVGQATTYRRSIEDELLRRFPFLEGWPQAHLLSLHRILRDRQLDETSVVAVLTTYKDSPKEALAELRALVGPQPAPQPGQQPDPEQPKRHAPVPQSTSQQTTPALSEPKPAQSMPVAQIASQAPAAQPVQPVQPAESTTMLRQVLADVHRAESILISLESRLKGTVSNEVAEAFRQAVQAVKYLHSVIRGLV